MTHKRIVTFSGVHDLYLNEDGVIMEAPSNLAHIVGQKFTRWYARQKSRLRIQPRKD